MRLDGRHPCLLFGVLFLVAVSPIAGVAAFVVAGAAFMYGAWRLAPAVALRRIGAVPIEEQDDPRLYNVTEGLCATFGLSMPSLYVVDDEVPNGCAWATTRAAPTWSSRPACSGGWTPLSSKA